MLIIPPPTYRKRRRLERPGNVPIEIVSAVYSFGAWIELVFNQHISIAGIVVSAVSVNDGEYQGGIYGGTGSAVLISANTVKVLLNYTGDTETDNVILTVAAGNGIQAANGSGPWAGVADFMPSIA